MDDTLGLMTAVPSKQSLFQLSTIAIQTLVKGFDHFSHIRQRVRRHLRSFPSQSHANSIMPPHFMHAARHCPKPDKAAPTRHHYLQLQSDAGAINKKMVPSSLSVRLNMK